MTCGKCGATTQKYAYGRTPEGVILCFICCAEWEKQMMIETGRAILYLCPVSDKDKKIFETLGGTPPAWVITDWAGELTFQAGQIRKGKHNIARTRTDTWFVGPDGHVWWGVQYGENTTAIRCKRTKEVWSR